MTQGYVAIVPHYRHEQTLLETVQRLLSYELAVIVVDDASGEASERVLKQIENLPQVSLIRRTANGGKGAAVMTGIKAALQQGYQYGLQIDADLQHDFADIPRFIARSKAHPKAVICGLPQYDESAPKSRVYGRKITNFFLFLETRGGQIKDAMCGFRIYPLATVAAILSPKMSRGMDFDIECLVRLVWRKVPLQWLPTHVRYAADGVSHFHLFKDNLAISRLHARLLCVALMQLLGVKRC